MPRRFWLILIVFLPAQCFAAPEDISNLIASAIEAKPVPGAVACVVRGDKIIAAGAAGFRRRGNPDKVTINDKFHIGSCTKSMTATLCAMLVEEGKLRWDSTLAEVFPDFKDKMQPAYRKATLEQLLSHRAGVPPDWNTGDWNNKIRRADITNLEGHRIVFEAIVTNPPIAPPGERFFYSNAGYIIAGYMAEKVTGETWEDLMQKRLFDPLGMKSAGFGAPDAGDKNQPHGHLADGTPVDSAPNFIADNAPAIGPAGTVHCSVLDWAKFAMLHLDGETGKPRLLKAETFKKLHTAFRGRPGEMNYALGWTVFTFPWAKGVTLTHAGSNNMFYCNMLIAPNRDLAILIMTNQGMPPGREAEQEIEHRLIDRFAR